MKAQARCGSAGAFPPEIIPEADWSNEPHFLYSLGPAIEPPRPVRTGNIFRNQTRVVRPGPAADERDNPRGQGQDPGASSGSWTDERVIWSWFPG